jgi:hypothetical protein
VASQQLSDDLTAVLTRLRAVEDKLDALLEQAGAQADQREETWIERNAACHLLGISPRLMGTLLSQGVIKPPAVRNVGTPRSPRYRFHRRRTLEQFLARC